MRNSVYGSAARIVLRRAICALRASHTVCRYAWRHRLTHNASITMSFIRKIEDFVCEQCGARVTGSGYTNHCPKCLWSKHVDEHPGDRASLCKGAMEPRSVEVVKGAEKVVHRCLVCGFIRTQEVSKEDDPNAIIALSAQSFAG